MPSPIAINPGALLSQAIAHHQTGRWLEAEKLYRAFLARQARQPDAHHNLGVLAIQTGRMEEGLPVRHFLNRK